MEKQEILAIYGTKYKEMTKTLLQEADLEGQILKKDWKIGIKPNLVAPSEASYGATTHSEIVAGIIEYLQEREFSNLVILESSWVGDKTAEAAEVCGYYELSERYHVPFIDLQKDTYQTYSCQGMELKICDEVKSLDFLINVPVMKGHCQTKITCALKNLKGLIPNCEKRHFHAMGLHEPIAHLAAEIAPDFTVVDSICGDWDFEDGGNSVELNRILAAADPVLCDAYVCHFMGYEVEEVPYIKMAEALGAGSAQWKAVRFHELNKPKQGEYIPKARKVVEVCDAVEEVESCSACYGYLLPALWRLKEEGLLQNLTEKICIGQGYRGQEGKLGVGNCTRGFQNYVKGCPPTEDDIYEFLKNYIVRK